jgi:hypothetical protein
MASPGRGVGLSRPGRDRGVGLSRPGRINRINHHHRIAGKPKPPPCFNRKPKRPKEQREKREQREERANEKKREKFSEEMRGERKNPEEISVCFGGVRADKKWFFNFYKVYSNLSKMKGYCSLCKKI